LFSHPRASALLICDLPLALLHGLHELPRVHDLGLGKSAPSFSMISLPILGFLSFSLLLLVERTVIIYSNPSSFCPSIKRVFSPLLISAPPLSLVVMMLEFGTLTLSVHSLPRPDDLGRPTAASSHPPLPLSLLWVWCSRSSQGDRPCGAPSTPFFLYSLT